MSTKTFGLFFIKKKKCCCCCCCCSSWCLGNGDSLDSLLAFVRCHCTRRSDMHKVSTCARHAQFPDLLLLLPLLSQLPHSRPIPATFWQFYCMPRRRIMSTHTQTRTHTRVVSIKAFRCTKCAVATLEPQVQHARLHCLPFASLCPPLLPSFHVPSSASLNIVCLLRGANNHLRCPRRLHPKPEPSSSYSPRSGAGLGEVRLALRGGSLKVRHFLSTTLQISCNLPRPALQGRPPQKPEHILIKCSLNRKKRQNISEV